MNIFFNLIGLKKHDILMSEINIKKYWDKEDKLETLKKRRIEQIRNRIIAGRDFKDIPPEDWERIQDLEDRVESEIYQLYDEI